VWNEVNLKAADKGKVEILFSLLFLKAECFGRRANPVFFGETDEEGILRLTSPPISLHGNLLLSVSKWLRHVRPKSL